MASLLGWPLLAWTALALASWPWLSRAGPDGWACLALALLLSAWHGWAARKRHEADRRQLRRAVREGATGRGDPAPAPRRASSWRPRLRLYDPREA